MKHGLHILPLLVAAMALVLSPTCFAAEDLPEVLFDGSSHKIVITPAETLFGKNIETMMPGDTLTGTVRLYASGTPKTELFLTAAPINVRRDAARSENLGSNLKLTVRLLDGDGTPHVVYDGSFDGVIEPRTSLGVYGNGTVRNLEFTVSAPATLENAYHLTSAITEWTFYAEQEDEIGGGGDDSPAEVISEVSDSENAAVRPLSVHLRAPQTGAQRASLAVLAGGTALCGAGFVLTRRKKSKR